MPRLEGVGFRVRCLGGFRVRSETSPAATGGGGGEYSPSLDFSDYRNSMYVACIF